MSGTANTLLITLPALILAVEVVLIAPLSRLLKAAGQQGKKSVRLIRSERISDHWKEVALRHYASVMLRASLGICLWLAVIIAVLTLGIYASAAVLDTTFADQLDQVNSIEYLLASSAVALIYFILRRRMGNA